MGSGVDNGLSSNGTNNEGFGSSNGVGNNCVGSDMQICASGDLKKSLACLDAQPATMTIGLAFS